MVYRHCECCQRRDEDPVTREVAAKLYLCRKCRIDILFEETRRDKNFTLL